MEFGLKDYIVPRRLTKIIRYMIPDITLSQRLTVWTEMIDNPKKVLVLKKKVIFHAMMKTKSKSTRTTALNGWSAQHYNNQKIFFFITRKTVLLVRKKYESAAPLDMQL